jgi:hypothetical protein
MKVNIMRLPESITEFGKTDSYSVLMIITREEAEAFCRDTENGVAPSAMLGRLHEMMRAMADGAGNVVIYNMQQAAHGG